MGGARVRATDVIVATGSAPRLLPGIELTDRIITSDQALWYDRIPASAVVIGAGAVGLEFASDLPLLRCRGHACSRRYHRLAPARGRGDLEGDRACVRKRGHHDGGRRLRQPRSRTWATRSRSRTRLRAETVTTSADVCLVAIGRGPVTAGLELAEAGVALHEKGFVNVDDQLRTNVAARLGRGRRRVDPAPARPRGVHRGLRGGRADRGPGRAGYRLREHPARHLLHPGDRERRPHRGPGLGNAAGTS